MSYTPNADESLDDLADEPAPEEGHRKNIRVRPMGPKLEAKYPKTRSIIITHMDGKQLCLVRKGG